MLANKCFDRRNAVHTTQVGSDCNDLGLKSGGKLSGFYVVFISDSCLARFNFLNRLRNDGGFIDVGDVLVR